MVMVTGPRQSGKTTLVRRLVGEERDYLTLDETASLETAQPKEVVVGEDLAEIVLTGGFPEMLFRTDEGRRQAWARDYTHTLLQRDVGDIAEVEKREAMARLFRMLAHHSAKLVNFSQLGGQVGLDDKTARRYVLILEQLFLVRRLEPWFRNRVKRLVKTPKVHLLDSGILGASIGIGQRSELFSRPSCLPRSFANRNGTRSSGPFTTTGTRIETKWISSRKTSPAGLSGSR